MLKKLISRVRKSDSRFDEKTPLASEKGVAGILAEIRPEDGEGAVLDVDHWLLETEFVVGKIDGSALRQAVCRLDEFVQGALRATWSAWFEPTSKLNFSEKVWQTLVSHHAALAAAYARCLADPQLAADADGALLPRLAARRMRVLVLSKKLQRLRYRAPDPAWWDEVGRLLAWARERAATQTPVALYAGEEPSSVWQEYLVGLYLELAPVDGMLQRQIEATDALLRKFAGSLVVRAQSAGSEQYCLDPTAAQGIFRRDPERSYPASVGYIGFDSLRAQIVRLVAQMRGDDDEILPQWLAHACLPPSQVKELLQSLAMAWSVHPPQRRSERNSSEGEARAVFGFGLVRRMAACSALARSGRRISYDTYLNQLKQLRFSAVEGWDVMELDPDQVVPVDPFEVLEKLEVGGRSQAMETWYVRDVSAGGVGVQLPHILGRHRIGKLVGFRVLSQVDWHAGIIRRLRRDGSGRSLAGIEWLPGPPQCAQARALRAVEHGHWSTLRELTGHGFIDAVLLAGPDPELLLPSGTFSQDAAFRLVVEGNSRNVRLTRLVGEGDDYERVAFAEIVAAAVDDEPIAP